MYPILITCIRYADSWEINSHSGKVPQWHNYPPDIDDLLIRVPLRSMCVHQCYLALVEAGILSKDVDYTTIRWRAVVPINDDGSIYMRSINESSIELWTDSEDDTEPMRLITRLPITGSDFANLPLVVRLGIELMWRKECNGNDSE